MMGLGDLSKQNKSVMVCRFETTSRERNEACWYILLFGLVYMIYVWLVNNYGLVGEKACRINDCCILLSLPISLAASGSSDCISMSHNYMSAWTHRSVTPTGYTRLFPYFQRATDHIQAWRAAARPDEPFLDLVGSSQPVLTGYSLLFLFSSHPGYQ
jgi:hypothetical protein